MGLSSGLSWKLVRGHFRRHALEFVLCIVGVALGAAVTVAIDGAVAASIASFRGAVSSVSGEASHHIVPRVGRLVPDEDYIALRRALPDIAFVPVIERYLVGFDSEGGEDSGGHLGGHLGGQLVRLLGIDPFSDPELRSYTSVRIDLDPERFRRFITEPGAVTPTVDLARTLGVDVGDTFTVEANGALHTLHVVGLVEVTGPWRDQLRDLLIADLSTAQELTGQLGSLSRIEVDLTAGSGASAGAADAIRAALPDHLALQEVSDRGRQLEDLIAAYTLNLHALSTMASFVALFIVYNALLVSVEQRMTTLAVLRCLGASRLQLASIYLVEALGSAIVGGVLGILGGWLLSYALVGGIAGTINDLYAPIRPPDVTLTSAMVIKGMAVALASGLLGAVVPLVRAARTPPISLMRPSDARRSSLRAAGSLAGLGVVCLIVAYVMAVTPSRSIPAAFVVALLTATGFALLCPLVTAWLARAIAALPRGTGRLMPIRLAGSSVRQALGITGTAVAAMMLAMAMNVALLTMVQSFREGVLQWLDLRFRAEVYLAPRALIEHRVDSPIDPAVVEWVDAQPETQDYVTYRRIETQVNGQLAFVTATQLSKLLGRGEIPLRTPGDEAFVPASDVIISEPLAGRHGLGVGDTFEMVTPSGLTSVRVHAVYIDFANDRGEVMMQRDAFVERFGDSTINALHVYVGGHDKADTIARLWQDELQKTWPVVAQSYGYIKSETRRVFDRTFRVTDVLGWIAGAVAFCGLAGALLALSVARRREYGILSTLGMSHRQVVVWVIAEGLIVAMVAAAIASVAGLALAYVLAYVIQYRSFGWSIPMAVQPWLIVQAFVVCGVAAILASWWPLRRLRRDPPAASLR